MTTLAVVVTTYNRPNALTAVLEAYLAQRDTNFELIVADDGSTDETRRAVRSFRARADFPVEHVWHEDRGFRAGAIRNRAIARTAAQYVVFTDGDCIPMPGFVATHRRRAERGSFVSGSRLLFTQEATRRVLDEAWGVHAWPWGRWIAARARGEVNRLWPLVALPAAFATSNRFAHRWEKARTCNLGVWRNDLLAINGFDETFEGWGLEDSDLALRLIHHGVRHRRVTCGLGVAHLWHPENPRGNLDRNRRLLEELHESRRTRARRGIEEYEREVAA
jgi:glycosyltransferase involved in cell wall biosynthesis